MFALISNDDILGHLAQMMGNLDGAGIHSAAWLATVLNSPGHYATTPTRCLTATLKVTERGQCFCWTSRWLFRQSLA